MINVGVCCFGAGDTCRGPWINRSGADTSTAEVGAECTGLWGCLAGVGSTGSHCFNGSHTGSQRWKNGSPRWNNGLRNSGCGGQYGALGGHITVGGAMLRSRMQRSNWLIRSHCFSHRSTHFLRYSLGGRQSSPGTIGVRAGSPGTIGVRAGSIGCCCGMAMRMGPVGV